MGYRITYIFDAQNVCPGILSVGNLAGINWSKIDLPQGLPGYCIYLELIL